jgi:hypothetical protein
MENSGLVHRLYQFLEEEAKSCSMDFGCITPSYVYRMWGGNVALEDIEDGLKEIKKGIDSGCVDE